MRKQLCYLMLTAPVFLGACENRSSVNAYFYPNSADLTNSFEFNDVGSVENCRAVVREAARLTGNPSLDGADYECCVDPKKEKIGNVTVCKETRK